MGFFDFLKGTDINTGVNQYKDTPGAVLVDVRESDEYRGGHISHSINVPLGSLCAGIEKAVPDKSTPLFIYCLSGGRSSKATAELIRMGYESVTNIGGINGWSGPVER